MNLSKKKTLAAKALNVGKNRIKFVTERLDEIKEILTKQDVKDLAQEGAIQVKEVSGRKKVVKRKRKRGPGKIRKKVNKRKQEYVIMTRKLRKYSAEMHKQGKISKEELIEIRKKIRNRLFKNKANLKQYIGDLKK